MEHTGFNNIVSSVIVYNKYNPKEVFLERKDDGHPIKLVRQQLCLLGGVWIGEVAKNDEGPIHTVCREIDEELSFDRPERNSDELAVLGLSDAVQTGSSQASRAPVDQADRLILNMIKREIKNQCRPYGAFGHTISKEALDSADPDNSRHGFRVLVCVFVSGLSQESWNALKFIQEKHGNLSSESTTIVTSYEKIVQEQMYAGFGYDHVLSRFFDLEKDGPKLPTIPGVTCAYLGHVLPLYSQFLDRYTIANVPK